MSPALPPTAFPAGRNPRSRLRATQLDLLLWTAQAWLAMFFVAAGYAKLTEPIQNLVALLGWPAATPLAFVQGVGVAEITLGLGMLLPGSSSTGRHLILLFALGLFTAAAMMTTVHAARADVGLAIVNGALVGLAGVVVWGRSRIRP